MKRNWWVGLVMLALMVADWIWGSGDAGGHVLKCTVLSGTIGAMLQSNTADQQNQENRRQANINLVLAMLSRGMQPNAEMLRHLGFPRGMTDQLAAHGSAVLPYYMGQSEQNLGMNAADMAALIQELNGGAQGTAEAAQRIADQAGEGDTAMQTFANDLATGRTTDQMLAENQPVQAARMGVATGKRNAALESLAQTLNDIDAIQSKKGYGGDSTGTRMMKFNARRGINTQAANDINEATFQNAVEKAGLQMQGRQMRLSNPTLGDTVANMRTGRLGAAGRAVAAQGQTSMAPLSFFNLGPHDFSRYDANQQVPPGWGELAARQANSTGSSLLNYYLQKNLQNRAGGGGGGGGGSYSNNWGGNQGGWSGTGSEGGNYYTDGANAPAYGGYDSGSMDWSSGL